jgi:lipoprotein-releasing system permease protein
MPPPPHGEADGRALAESRGAAGGTLAGPLAFRIALRFLAGRGSQLLGSTARAALAASTLGVTAMGIAMALMTGYREDLEAKLVGGNAAVLAYPPHDVERAAEVEALRGRIAAMPGVTRVDSVAYVQGVVSSAAGEAEITLRGSGAGGGLVTGSPELLAPDAEGVAGIALGVDLAETLRAKQGERLRLVVVAMGDRGPQFVYRTVRFAGTFDSGFAEFDQAWGVATRELVKSLAPGSIDSLELALAEPAKAGEVAEEVRRIAPDGTVVTDWRELNRELFAALKLQQLALFLLLGLIVLVSTFNVASTLVVLVRERLRDLGVLAAMGLPPRRMQQVFLLYGGALGVAGALLGLALAFAFSWVANRYELISFGPDIASIYFLRAVPFRLSLEDAAATAAFTVAVTFLSCWLPSRRALKLDPAAALRFE